MAVIPGRKRLPIFAKVLLLFLAAVLPLYVLNVRTTMQGQNDVRREIAYAALSRIGFYIGALEKDLSNLVRMQSRLINDLNLRELRRPPGAISDYERYRAMNAVRDALAELKDMSSYVSSAAVYLPEEGWKIANDSSEAADAAELGRIKERSVLESFPFSTFEGRTFVNITPELYSTASEESGSPSFIISVEISQAEVRSVLDQISGSELGGAFLLGDGSGLSVGGTGSAEVQPFLERFVRERRSSGPETGMETVETERGTYSVSYGESGFLHSTLVVYIPEARLLSSLGGYTTGLWIGSAVTLAMVLLFYAWAKRMVAEPLGKLMSALAAVQTGSLDVSVHYGKNDEFGYLYRSFNSMVDRLKALIHELYEQKLLVQRAELKQLQYQINPHFLYNSILIAHSLVRMQDYEGALRMSEHLGSYYRYLTRSEPEAVRLDQEIAHAKDYLAIQSIRFGSRVSVELGEIPPGCEGILVPRLIVQPVIENCFSHGFRDMASDARLQVRMTKEGGFLVISVEDNGEGIDEPQLAELRRLLGGDGRDAEKSGLLNVHRRIQIKHGSGSGVSISSGEPHGFRVEIRIAT